MPQHDLSWVGGCFVLDRGEINNAENVDTPLKPIPIVVAALS